MIEIIQDKILPTAENIKHLYQQHWEEVYGKSSREVDIMLDLYGKFDDAGLAFALWAYDNMEVVGYSINFIAPNVHSRGHISCNNDALFVHPNFRESPLGLRLIRGTEKEAVSRGADLMCWNAPLNTALIKILPRLKYKAIEQVFVKEI